MRRMTEADLSVIGEKKGFLGMVLMDLWDAGRLVADGEVNRHCRLTIHYCKATEVRERVIILLLS